jgi:hypothetical protein
MTTKQKMIQRLVGVIFVLAGIASIIPTRAITFAIFSVPVGIYLFTSKERWVE